MVAPPIIEALREGRLIAFLGAGVCRSFTDPETGTDFPGLPSASELVSELRKTRVTLISPNATFPQACFLLREAEGRVSLERFLQTHLDKPALRPLPAHFLCANLPFSTFITTNFDSLMAVNYEIPFFI